MEPIDQTWLDQQVGWIREGSDETMKFKFLGILDIQMRTTTFFELEVCRVILAYQRKIIQNFVELP